MEEKEITFEDAMKKLESIAETLGEGNLSLEESLKMFEEGMELCKFCNTKLDEAGYKVEKLMEREREGRGEISVEEFEAEA
ncbi:Exodeoxyribonuclease 7 small subunit [ANME-1 cluster archaeon GoMg1]|nr:Exodeoxyribonuclease 7 small subunit [ANME-1 cluster archaeon GoMg1]